MEKLADEGYHCLAPDQRGYSPGARPDDVSEYNYTHFAADAVAFMDVMGWDRAHLIGHDWGALAGWATVGLSPERITSWTSLSIPHIKSFGTAIRENDEQTEKSGYVNLFRQEGTAETALSANDFDSPGAGVPGVHPDCVATVDELDTGFTASGLSDPITALVTSGSAVGGTGPAGILWLELQLTSAGTMQLDVTSTTSSDFLGNPLVMIPVIDPLTVN